MKPYLSDGGERGRRRELLIFVLFLTLAVVLRTLPAAYREPIARGIRSTVLRPVLATQRAALESEIRFVDPARLRAERDSLAVLLVGQTTLAAENRQLRELLGLRERLPPSFIPAEVIRIRERAYEGLFLLTLGREDGLRAGAPIISAEGLVGVVRDADERYATAIDWTHPEFRASAMTVDGETYGIVEPRSGLAGDPMLVLTGTAFHTDLPAGTVIVTSGIGGVYPHGVPIGTVIRAEEAEGGWRTNYLILPFVSPAEMRHVLVLGEPRETLAGQNLASSWGIRVAEPSATDSARDSLAVLGEPLSAGRGQNAPRGTRAGDAGPRLLGTPVRPPEDTAGNVPR